jgi:hypothetical protein
MEILDSFYCRWGGLKIPVCCTFLILFTHVVPLASQKHLRQYPAGYYWFVNVLVSPAALYTAIKQDFRLS